MDAHFKLAPTVQLQDQFEFLPGALEVLESPPAPFGRIIAGTIAVFFVLGIIWAWWGLVGVVVIAQGQIVPTGQVKVVQPLETGVVKAIHVREGQTVQAGELLIELDPTESKANIDTLHFDLQQAQLDVAAGAALLAQDPAKHFTAPQDIAIQLIKTTRNLLADGIAQKPMVLSLRQKALEQQAALNNTIENRSRSKADIAALEARRTELVANFRFQAGRRRQEALRKVATLEQALKKEQQRQRYRQLTAPVAGRVHQLMVHTVGAVVNSAQQLLTIVPDYAPLQLETIILNKDIGFVTIGQEVAIKLEAFPFTRYGTLAGQMLSLGDDASL
jgi:hemolysin D